MRVLSFEKWKARNYIAEVRNDHDAKLQVHETLQKKHTSKKHIGKIPRSELVAEFNQQRSNKRSGARCRQDVTFCKEWLTLWKVERIHPSTLRSKALEQMATRHKVEGHDW